MTKKHFISLADHIHNHNVVYGKRSPDRFREAHINQLASFCAYQNGNFNRERWLSYIAGECGPNGGTIKPPSKPRYITPERKLARRLEGKDPLKSRIQVRVEGLPDVNDWETYKV